MPSTVYSVTLHLPPNCLTGTYFKYGGTPNDPNPHWYDFNLSGSTGAVFGAGSVTLNFVDGARGDDQANQANAWIQDPGGPVTFPAGVGDPSDGSAAFQFRNAPNPFAATTAFTLGLPEAAVITIEIFDIAGRQVRVIRSPALTAGEHTLTWDGRVDDGRLAAPGIYLVRARGGVQEAHLRVALIR
jgi:hypothetical protein